MLPSPIARDEQAKSKDMVETLRPVHTTVNTGRTHGWRFWYPYARAVRTGRVGHPWYSRCHFNAKI